MKEQKTHNRKQINGNNILNNVESICSKRHPRRSEGRNTQRGITLIALIITIIILLILAVVSIRLVMNDDVLGKAEKATTAYGTEAEKEQIKIGYSDYQMAKESGKKATLAVAGASVTGTGPWTITFDKTGNQYTVSADGKTITAKGSNDKVEISKEENFVGCYADIDKDGTVDGVIFVDLLTGSKKENQTWGSDKYTLPTDVTVDNVNTYYVSQSSYTDSLFGTHPVISPSDANGVKRFYVMSLSDFTTESYTLFYWYKNALYKMNESDTSVDFGKGKTNTGKMIEIWNTNGYGVTQDNQDIWKHIQTKYNEGWFIPSKEEWCAFSNELGDKFNHVYYWSSSIKESQYAWYANYWMYGMNYSDGDYNGVNACRNVRLATNM